MNFNFTHLFSRVWSPEVERFGLSEVFQIDKLRNGPIKYGLV